MSTSLRTPGYLRQRNAVFAAFALNGLGFATWAIRLPALREHLELNPAELGRLLLGISSGSIIGLLLAAHVVHWLGVRLTIALTLFVCAIGLVLTSVGAALLANFWFVLLSMGLYGMGTAICDVAMNIEGATVEKASGKTMLPLFHAVWSVGSVAGTSLGTAIAFAQINVIWHMPAVAVLIAIGAWILPRFLPGASSQNQKQADSPKQSFSERMSTWLEPRTIALGLIALGMAFTEGSAGDWLAIGMIDDRGLDEGSGAAIFTAFSVAMMVGRAVGGPMVDRFGRMQAIRFSGASAAFGLALVIFVPIIPVVVFGVLLWGLGASLGFPLAMSAAADDPQRATARVSAVAAIGYCAFLVGPPLLGLIGKEIGVLRSLLIVFVLIVVATLAAPSAREKAPAKSEKD